MCQHTNWHEWQEKLKKLNKHYTVTVNKQQTSGRISGVCVCVLIKTNQSINLQHPPITPPQHQPKGGKKNPEEFLIRSRSNAVISSTKLINTQHRPKTGAA